MGSLLEISTVKKCRVFFEKTCDEQARYFFSAYVQLPDHTQFIMDDRHLPRLKKRIHAVLEVLAFSGSVPLEV